MYSPDIEPKCALCQMGEPLPGNKEVVCDKYGVVPYDYVCKKYKYDIFKKKVRRKNGLDGQFSDDDFSIE